MTKDQHIAQLKAEFIRMENAHEADLKDLEAQLAQANERVKELEVISDDACSNLMLLTENNRRLMEWLKKLEADKEALVAMVEFLKLKNKNLEAETIEKARLYVDSPEFYVLSRERRADAMAEKLRSSNGYN